MLWKFSFSLLEEALAQALQALVIDDHELFRAGLRHLIDGIAKPIRLHEAESVADAIAQTFESPIELVLLDLNLPDKSGVAAIKAAKENFTNATVVVLSGNDDALVIREAIDHGAAGFIPKSVSHPVFLAALELVIAGEIYVPKQALSDIALLQGESAPKVTERAPNNELDGLTERQRASLLLAIKGFSNKKIARNLNITEGTVKAHLSAAFRVIGVSNRTEAVLRFAQSNED